MLNNRHIIRIYLKCVVYAYVDKRISDVRGNIRSTYISFYANVRINGYLSCGIEDGYFQKSLIVFAQERNSFVPHRRDTKYLKDRK